MQLSQQTFSRANVINIESLVRTVPDFPKPGIMFKDITPILANPDAFGQLIDQMSQEVRNSRANVIVGLESRGFIFGIAIAKQLALPFVAARKAGKLPGATVKTDYTLEYGSQSLELQVGSIGPNDKVAIVDDLLATGGTALAASRLITQMGGQVSGYFFAAELVELNGRRQLTNATTDAVLKF